VTRIDDAIRRDAAAIELGRIAQKLDGSASAPDDAAGRERMLIALDARGGSRRRWLLPTAAAALLAVVAIGVTWALRPARIEYRVSGSSLQIDGDWLGVAADRGAGLLRFSEGTEMEIGPGSKSRVAELTPHGAHVVLGSGALHARVVHRPHTRWLVGAGPYSIDVTGTTFDVDWSSGGGRLEVRLHDGSVVVRGPSLHEGIRVGAGQRLVAHAKTGNAELSSLLPAKLASEPAEPAPAPVPERRETTVAPPHPAPSWSDLLTSGNFRGVLALAQARGIDATLRRGSLADLVALSDAARYAGDRALSRRGLSAQRARFFASAEAHAAAFVLGRMADDDGAQDEALRWYDGYLRESPRGPFAAEALGRKLVVVVRSGDAAQARAVAKLYLQRFPRGAHAAYARELLPAP
jgi:ferric-dicitrate binding protein FerR (iron transport regulator)